MNISNNNPNAPPYPNFPIAVQPSAPMASNVIVVQNIQPRNNLWDFDNEWHSDLCNLCEDCGTCCFAYFCWSCFVCSLLSKTKEHCCVYMCVGNPLVPMRTKIRTMFRIKGSILNDCCVTTFCSLCSAIQMSNELNYRGV